MNTTTNLNFLYNLEDKNAFIAAIKAYRQANWPLAVLAEHLSLSKTTISRWEHRETSLPLPEVEEYPTAPQLEPSQQQELADLAAQASQVRRMTPQKSPIRAAQQRLEALLLHYHSQGVTVSDLARHCNVTRRAIYQRLEKYDRPTA